MLSDNDFPLTQVSYFPNLPNNYIPEGQTKREMLTQFRELVW